jgi:hypothetical protein
MRWPRFFADATYRNPHVWTRWEWLTAFALALAAGMVVTMLLWPLVMLLVGK